MTSDLAPGAPNEPERAAYLRQYLAAIATRGIDAMVADLSAPSTDSSSAADRLMMAALRPWIPKLRGLLLARLSEADPASLERVMGAVSAAIEGLLYHAPGDPEPRYRFALDAEGRIRLEPVDG